MTIDDDAKQAFEALDLDRDTVLLAAKCVAQQIIDNSRADDTPLGGMVYDVWGLYNDGMPKCRWTSPYENDDLVFSAQFRVREADAFVTRREVLSPDDFQAILQDVQGIRAS
jgi:hypothetical protein